MKRTVPRPYQLEGIRLIQKAKGRALLADDMGIGKTPQALWWIRKHCPPGPVIVVCFSNVKENWKREARRHAGIQAEVLEKVKPPRHGLRHRAGIYVINYDILDGRGRGVNKGRTWVEELSRLNPVAIVVDECQAISNMGTKRSKAVKRLCDGVPHVLMLSGTPLTNTPSELFPAVHILWPKRFPSFHPYAVKYCAPKKRRWGWEFKGATNLGHLHRKLKKCGMIRRLKQDVLKELPAKTRSILPVKLTSKQMKEYKEAAGNFLVWMRKVYPTKARSAATAEKLVQLGYLRRLAAELKMKYVVDWIDSFLRESTEKLIVFGIHKAILGMLKEQYATKCVFVDGSVSGKKRQLAVDQFTHDKSKRLFIGNIKAAGTGWNGTAASTVLFVEMAWTPGDHAQAEARPHRFGQKGGVNIVYLVAAGTIEEMLCQIIQVKQENLDKVLDGSPIKDNMNVFDLLTEKLTKGTNA